MLGLVIDDLTNKTQFLELCIWLEFRVHMLVLHIVQTLACDEVVKAVSIYAAWI